VYTPRTQRCLVVATEASVSIFPQRPLAAANSSDLQNHFAWQDRGGHILLPPRAIGVNKRVREGGTEDQPRKSLPPRCSPTHCLQGCRPAVPSPAPILALERKAPS